MTNLRGVFVTGTDTGVGKTYIGTAVIQALITRAIRVIPRKPVESGCTFVRRELFPADAASLHAAAGRPGSLDEVCPYRFERPISPARAARLEALRVTIADLAQAVQDGVGDECFLWVEGAGGFYSPLASDGLNADLAVQLGLPVLLVAADRIGCINHILLTAEAIETRGLDLVAVVLDQTMPESIPAMDNAEDLKQHLDCRVFRVEHVARNDAARPHLASLVELLI